MTEHASALAPVEPGSDRWSALVTQAQRLDASRNWLLGDSALEIAPMGETHAHNGAMVNLAAFADETGVGIDVLHACRRSAHAWRQGTRVPSTCWKVHDLLRGHPELIEPGMTVTQAHVALGHSTAGRPTIGRPGPFVDDPDPFGPDNPVIDPRPPQPGPYDFESEVRLLRAAITNCDARFHRLVQEAPDDQVRRNEALDDLQSAAEQLLNSVKITRMESQFS